MIAHVRGTVSALTLSAAVVDVGGIGFHVQCTPGTLAGLRVGHDTQIHTSMVVREDSMTLFGFADDDEKATFELVQTASGVGPKVAQAIVAVLSPDTLRIAIAHDDVKTLTKVPGIGPKGAQRIILELKDRIGAPRGAGSSVRIAAAPWRAQVTEALLGLGYNPKDADRAVELVPEPTGEVNVSALLKAALQALSKA